MQLVKSWILPLSSFAFIYALWAFSYILPFQKEQVIYQSLCSVILEDGECYGLEMMDRKTTYRADAEKQSVIFWHNEDLPERLSNCVVRDKMNWICTRMFAGGTQSDVTSMAAGVLNISSTSEMLSELIKLNASRLHQIPKWRWGLLWLSGQRPKP